MIDPRAVGWQVVVPQTVVPQVGPSPLPVHAGFIHGLPTLRRS